MSNEIREKDHEWVKTFHSNFDRLLALLEKLLEKRQPSAYGDELLTDKEVAYLLKVSRRTLQDYRNNGILPYTQVGGKIPTGWQRDSALVRFSGGTDTGTSLPDWSAAPGD